MNLEHSLTLTLIKLRSDIHMDFHSKKDQLLQMKIFRPAADPFPEARDGQNLISWRWSLPLPTNPVW